MNLILITFSIYLIVMKEKKMKKLHCKYHELFFFIIYYLELLKVKE